MFPECDEPLSSLQEGMLQSGEKRYTQVTTKTIEYAIYK